MRGYFSYLRGRYVAAGREWWAEVQSHVQAIIAGGVVVLLLAVAGWLEEGLKVAIAGAVGAPALVALGLYLAKFLGVPYALHKAHAAKSIPAPEDRIEKLLAEQARIAAVPIQPRFDIILTTDGEGQREAECLEIWNEGQPMLGYGILPYTFLRVYRADLNEYRYVPGYYFLEKKQGREMTGLLMTLIARVDDSLFGVVGVNTQREVERIEAELKEQCGANSMVFKKWYLGIDYIDLAGTSRTESFEAGPTGWSWWGPANNWRRLNFSAHEYSRFMHGPYGHLWELSAALIQERWPLYTTPDDLMAAGLYTV